MEELMEMMTDQLRDAHSAERQAIQLMKRILRKVTSPELRQGLEAHIAQSEEQRERVEEALEAVGSRAGRKVCEAMRGLVEEAQHEMEEYEKGPLLDLLIVAAQQRIEHYEIASYGTMTELSKAIGQNKIAELMGRTLQEEKQQDERLTQLTRESILPELTESMSGGEEGAESEEEAEVEVARPARRSQPRKRG